MRGTYLLGDGTTLAKDYVVPAHARYNVWVDQETFDGTAGTPLANVSEVSTRFDVLSGPDIVAERAMWWPGPTAASWTEAHNSPGATGTAARWVAAAGAVTDGASATDTFYLLANPGAATASAKVTLLYADGTPEESKTFSLGAHSRLTVNARAEFPASVGKGFSALVETDGSTPVIVEWAVYGNASGQAWAAGANALATPLP